jgi:8-oxo-dGTP diphosphatase
MRRYAGVIAMYDEQVALVREQYKTWDAPYWNLPSGSIEDGETPAAGAIRELREESGLCATEQSLELVWTTAVIVDGLSVSRSWNYQTVVDDPSFAIDDPDGLILEAQWFPRQDAVRLLQQQPWPAMGVPAVHYLTTGVRRLDWMFTVSDEAWSWELPTVED